MEDNTGSAAWQRYRLTQLPETFSVCLQPPSALPVHPYLNPSFIEVSLEFPDRISPEMRDGGDQGCIRHSRGEYIVKIFGLSSASARDDRYLYPRCDHPVQLQIIPLSGPVRIDGYRATCSVERHRAGVVDERSVIVKAPADRERCRRGERAAGNGQIVIDVRRIADCNGPA